RQLIQGGRANGDELAGKGRWLLAPGDPNGAASSARYGLWLRRLRRWAGRSAASDKEEQQASGGRAPGSLQPPEAAIPPHPRLLRINRGQIVRLWRGRGPQLGARPASAVSRCVLAADSPGAIAS